jgi:hypothetical protein
MRPARPSTTRKTAPPPKPIHERRNGVREPKPRPTQGTRPAKGPSPATVWAVIVLGLALVFALPTLLVVAIGMVPAMVAVFIDQSPKKHFGICVAGLNFAGVAPFLAELWGGHNGVGTALKIIGNVYAWFVMYGAAGVGWVLYLFLPAVVAGFLAIRAETRLAELAKMRARLAGEWGIGRRAVGADEPVADEAPESIASQ